MEGMNKHLINGTVGSDVDFRAVGESSQVAKFSVATNRTYKDRNGQKQTDTQWHTVECWGKLATFARDYIKKGNNVHVEGEVRTDKYDKTIKVGDQETTITMYATKTHAKVINFLPSAKGNATTSAQDAQQQVQNLTQNTPAPAQNVVNADQGAFDGSAEDDLPF